MSVPGISSTYNYVNSSIQDAFFQRIKEVFNQADSTQNIHEKKEAYEKAFQLIVEKARVSNGIIPSEYHSQLFTLLEAFAGKCCYAQQGKDDQEGFRKSARLMEYSLGLQWDRIQGWPIVLDSDTLEDLVNILEYDKKSSWTLPQSMEMILKENAESMVRGAFEKGIQEQFASSLIRLAFSYQNISETNVSEHSECIQLHEKLQELCEASIGEGSIEQLKKLEDFRYNRALFMVNLKTPNDLDAKVKCYDPVIALTERAFINEPLKLKSRKAQIANMQGLIALRSGEPDRLIKAEPHFRMAFALRESLIGQFPTEKENEDQFFLLSNIRTSLIQISLASKNFLEAKEHALALRVFILELRDKGNNHAYITSYESAIDLVRNLSS